MSPPESRGRSILAEKSTTPGCEPGALNYAQHKYIIHQSSRRASHK